MSRFRQVFQGSKQKVPRKGSSRFQGSEVPSRVPSKGSGMFRGSKKGIESKGSGKVPRFQVKVRRFRSSKQGFQVKAPAGSVPSMKFRGSGRVPTGSGRFRGSKSGFQAKVLEGSKVLSKGSEYKDSGSFRGSKQGFHGK